MADLDNPFAGIGSYFFPGNPGPMGASAQEMRRKIALAMMMKKSTAPKNLGEGLYSIGDSLSDALIGKNSVTQAAAASAAADKQIRDIERGVTPGKISETAVPEEGAEKTASVEPMPVGGNAPSWNTFAQEYSPGGLGLNQPQAAGLVGNLQAESTKDIKPSGVVGDQGTAFGSAQWRGPRLEALKQYAAGQGVDWRTTEAQQGFMRHEMLGTGNQPGREASAYAALTQAKTPAQAATAVDERYERSSGEHRGRRIANAENIARSLPNPRDDVAAVLAARAPPPAGLAGPQDALLGEVTGMAGPASALSYAPTASAGRTGYVTSDIPPVTGAVGGPMGQAVGDTLQQRQEAIRPPQAATPLAGPQVAQAPGVFPPVASDVKPIIPGGGFPQTMPQIQSAPPDPRGAIQKAPDEYEPVDRPIPGPPAKPGPGPVERQLGRVLYSDVDERVKLAAKAKIDAERTVSGAVYENQLKDWETKKADALKERELVLKYKMERPKMRADVRKTGLEADEKQLQLSGLPERLALERRELEAKVGKAGAEAQVAKLNADFQVNKGREREPFLKEFAVEKEIVSKVSGLLKSAKAADEALKTGDVVWGSGAEAKLALARIGSAFGNERARKVAEASEKYRHASDSTLAYGVMLVNGKDPRVSNADLEQAKGLTGTLDMQRASQQRIINAMREDLYGKVSNYEDLREQYLRDDPQHRFFKVDVTPTAPQDQVDVLLKYRDNPQAIATFDRDHGPGAAKLEIKRALRREERAKKVAREDD